MNNFNNYYNPYQQYVRPQQNMYAFVDGIEGAKAFQCAPNSIMLLMDSQLPICYKKQVNAYGQTILLEAYDLVPHVEKEKESEVPEEYVSKREFEEFKASLNKEE